MIIMGDGLRMVVGEGLGASAPGSIVIVAGGHPIQPFTMKLLIST